MSIKTNFSHTIRASYIGFVTQAIINNFAPLLFLTFQREPYDIPLPQITLLVTLNFATQLVVDALAAKYADKIGYKPLAVAAHICCAAGLAGLAFLPQIFSAPFAGLLVSVIIYAVGGGLIEVLMSPIVEACPTDPEKKSSIMSLLHSFYCWGLVPLPSFLRFLVLKTGRYSRVYGRLSRF
jgi:MFS family permease